MDRLGRHILSVLAVVALAITGCSPAADVADEPSSQGAQIDCTVVRCGLPQCVEGQHLLQRGNECCPTCVGTPSRCATILCLAVECPEGEIRVHRGVNDCCGHCVRAPRVAECNDDADCPQYACFACPCPTSSCQGHQCVTSTPPASTCGGGL